MVQLRLAGAPYSFMVVDIPNNWAAVLESPTINKEHGACRMPTILRAGNSLWAEAQLTGSGWRASPEEVAVSSSDRQLF